QAGFPTLGIFRPRAIKRLIIEPTSATWTQEELEILGQQLLFGEAPSGELEKVPYTFRYEFVCEQDGCPGHRLMCTDWEMRQAWRSWRDQYGAEWESAFRQRFEDEMIQKFDTHFFVGTVHQHPGS